MEYLQKKVFHPTKPTPSIIKIVKTKAKRNSGFISALLLPLITLIITGILGLSTLSLGIKNITKSQSYCIKANLNGQKKLGVLLVKILKLNSRVLFLHKTRKTLLASIVVAASLGQIPVVSSLKKSLEFIKLAQNIVITKQKYILAQSFLVKRKILKDFKKNIKVLKTSSIIESTFYKKALALKKQKIGDQAYTYHPVPDFINQQKISLEWKIQSFFPLGKNLDWILPAKTKAISHLSCTTTLQQKGELWISHLYH